MRNLIFLLLLIFYMPVYAALIPVEINIRNHINSNTQAQLNFLKKLTLINSGTSDIPGVHQVGEVIRPELEALGFKTYWVAEPKSFNRASTLMAEHPGKKGKRILLIGHLDTVFPINSQFREFTMAGAEVKGPGVVDDKGGLAIILYALKAMQSSNVLKDANITVVLTGDEEDSGKPASISRAPLIAAAKKSDIALDFEEAVSLDTASIGRRGISAWSITAHGIEAHSSLIFKKEFGAGAIFELARILNSMRTEMSNIKNITYNPGVILGGTEAKYDHKNDNGKAFGKGNVIAKIAVAKGDFRYLTPEERDTIKTKMREIVAKHLPGTSADINFVDGIPAMTPTAANQSLLEIYSHVSEDLGQGKLHVMDANHRGAGDISYVANIVPANLVGLGPMGWDTHSTHEKVDLKSLKIQTERAAVLMSRLVG